MLVVLCEGDKLGMVSEANMVIEGCVALRLDTALPSSCAPHAPPPTPSATTTTRAARVTEWHPQLHVSRFVRAECDGRASTAGHNAAFVITSQTTTTTPHLRCDRWPQGRRMRYQHLERLDINISDKGPPSSAPSSATVGGEAHLPAERLLKSKWASNTPLRRRWASGRGTRVMTTDLYGDQMRSRSIRLLESIDASTTLARWVGHIPKNSACKADARR